jgi:hypothetical protein
MLTLTALTKYTMESPPMTALPRSPEIQAKYDAFIEKGNNRSEFVNSMKCRLKNKRYYFTRNDFPYQTERHIEHWVCWYEKDTCPHEIVKEIEGKNHIITYWKNHSQNMSIQEINHIHIFIQK